MRPHRPALAGIVLLVTGARLQAEPPIAPSPEAVVPAALTTAADAAPRAGLGPVPLPATERAAKATTAPARSTDWRILAAVASAFALLAGYRVFAGRRRGGLPPDVFEVLGGAPFVGPHAVRVVRFGPKTLLVSVSSGGCRTLAELTDPQAAERMAVACRDAAVGRPPRRSPRAAVAAVLLAVASTAGVRADDVVGARLPAAAPVPPAPLAAVDNARPAPLPSVGLGRLFDPLAPGTVLPSAVLFGVMSLAPAVLLMTTCFVRMSVVLALVRQGLGAPQIPSNQVVASLAIFLSAMVMWPVWRQAWRDGVEPYQQGRLTVTEAADRGSLPIRRWMAAQIEQAGNRDTMLLFLARHPDGPRQVASYDDVPPETLLPAFLVSELETAFSIGFRLLLPFLVLDLLVATLVVSTGLVMLPPTLVSLPLKLLVFVAADGWTLVVQSLLDGLRSTAA